MKKILFVFGTRPEAIKMAPVIHKFRANHKRFKTIVCITAQHREMLDEVLDVFDIVPDYDLNIMKKNQDLFDITNSILQKLKIILKKEKPDVILVQGDTTSAFVSALSGFYLKIPVAHIEAGLRTYNKFSPYPEEINRHLVTILSDIHFVPTKIAKSNLRKEGIPSNKIYLTGNTVVDALYYIINKLRAAGCEERQADYFLKKHKIDLENYRIILVTGHRRESFGEAFENICRALKDIAQQNPEVVIIYPVHLNPNVQKPVYKILRGIKNVFLIPPLPYLPFVYLMSKAYLILTDSGGIQEEAPSLKKPILVMRETTERPEGIKYGVSKLAGTSREKIVKETQKLLSKPSLYKNMIKRENPYGDGKSAERIVKVISNL